MEGVWDSKEPGLSAGQTQPGSGGGAGREAADLMLQAAAAAAAAADQCRAAVARWEEASKAAELSASVGQQTTALPSSVVPSTPTASTGIPAVPPAVQASLQLTDATADAVRVMELVAMLIEFASSLDQVVWNTWKAVGPNSAVKRPAPLKGTMARFVTGEADTPRDKVKQDLERLRQMTAALTASVNQAGRQFAQRHIERFGSAEIERAVREEGGGGWGGLEAKCWKKYQQMSGTMDAEEIHRELLGAITSFTESLLRGIGR